MPSRNFVPLPSLPTKHVDMCKFFFSGVSCKMHVTNSTGSRKTLHQSSWWHSWTQTGERRGWGAFGITNPSTADGSACCGMAVICLLKLKADFGRKLHWNKWYKMEYITIVRRIMSNTVYSNMCEEKICEEKICCEIWQPKVLCLPQPC